jgi:hypothetical protein
MRIDGRCHCGAITYTAEVEPDTISLCHCTDCQMLTGTAYRANIPAPAATFELLTGTPKTYVKVAASGNRRRHVFCADCGTPIFACAMENPPTYSLRVGAIAQRARLRPAKQIWCRSALPWSGDLAPIPRHECQ